MTVLNLTTVAKVKELLGGQSVASDAVITALIGPVSESAATYMARHTLTATRTEVYPVEYTAPYVWLKGFPITSVATITLSRTRDFSDLDPLDTSTYDVIAETGEIQLRCEAFDSIGPLGFMQIVYVGGMALTDVAFIDAYPRIANAVTSEVINRVNRAKNPEGNVTFGGAGGAAYLKQMQPLDDFKNALASQRRIAV